MADICHKSTTGRFASLSTRGISIVPIPEAVVDEMSRSMPDFWQGQVFLVVINIGTGLASDRLLSGSLCGARNRNVEGLFPDGVIGNFFRTMALGST